MFKTSLSVAMLASATFAQTPDIFKVTPSKMSDISDTATLGMEGKVTYVKMSNSVTRMKIEIDQVTTGYELSEDDTLSAIFCMKVDFRDSIITYPYLCVNDEFVGKAGEDDDWTIDFHRKVYAVLELEVNGDVKVPASFTALNSITVSH